MTWRVTNRDVRLVQHGGPMDYRLWFPIERSDVAQNGPQVYITGSVEDELGDTVAHIPPNWVLS